MQKKFLERNIRLKRYLWHGTQEGFRGTVAVRSNRGGDL